MTEVPSRLYVCRPGCDCGIDRRCLDFLRGWGVAPTLGQDEKGPYLDFDLPPSWPAGKRREFLRAFRRLLPAPLKAAQRLARRMCNYIRERAKAEGVGCCLAVEFFEDAILSGGTMLFGVRHDGTRMLSDEQEPYDGYFARHAPNG